MGNIFYDDFRDFISALNDNNVEYVLVGGYSVIIHGYARTTGDMDILVNRNKQNYQKLTKAFNQFNMPVFDMTEHNFLNHPTWNVFSFGSPPVCIDILVEIKGVDFDTVFNNSIVFNDNDVSIRVIHLNQLIDAKKATNRPKDIDDINNLIK
jgi:hypothetical protein